MQPGLKGVQPCWEYVLSPLVKTWLLGQVPRGFAEFEVRPSKGVRPIVSQRNVMILQWFGGEWGVQSNKPSIFGGKITALYGSIVVHIN